MHCSNIKNVAKPYHPFDIIAIHRFRNRFPGQILTNFDYILTNFDEILTNADFLKRTLISLIFLNEYFAKNYSPL